jgi:ketosteroid isomerase-like protein
LDEKQQSAEHSIEQSRGYLLAMSQENVEVIKAAAHAWNLGDADAFRDLHDPEVILRPEKNWPEPGPYIGLEAVMGFYERMRDTFDADTVELTGNIADGGDWVVARWIWHGQGHGPESNMEATTLYAVRNGNIREVEFFWDHDEALGAAGLSE